jgi:hypothetical protein
MWISLLLGAAAAVVAGVWLAWPQKPPAPPSGPFCLRDVTRESGIAFRHTDGSSGSRYILEAMSAGLALFDYDGDALLDVYFVNGAPLRGATADIPPADALYRNLGQNRFVEVTRESATGDPSFGMGIAAGDYDNDGFPDIFVNNYGRNMLYRNNGDGTFADATDAAGVAGNPRFVGAGACFLDIEGDGDLDLHVGRYLEFSYDMHVNRIIDGLPSYPSPRDFHAVPDTLYRNNGDGTFADISVESGVARQAGTTMGMVACDVDKDGDTDIFALNDVMCNFFYQNDGRGNFREVGIVNGTAYNHFGDESASMGVDCGDYNRDGWLDFFMTSYQTELPILFQNTGGGMFEDATIPTNAGAGSYAFVKWGVALTDLDNDADLDIFIANGHTEDNVEERDSSTMYKAPKTILENVGAKFRDVSRISGDGPLQRFASRGSGCDDLDNDGDVDVVVLNSRELASVYENVTRNGNHWLEVQLHGRTSNREAVGSQVTVVTGDVSQLLEVHSGRGYQSHWGTRLHYGLGPHDRVDRLEIQWLGGQREIVPNLAADQIVHIVEGAHSEDPH